MSRFSKTSPPRWPVARTATSTMALAKSSARITWLGNTTRKRRIDRAQQAVAEIRLPARLHRADVRRPEEVNVGETCREQRILGLSLVASKGHPTSSGRVWPAPLKNENAAPGLLPRRTRANS